MACTVLSKHLRWLSIGVKGARSLHVTSDNTLRIGVQGAPMHLGQKQRGTELGPQTIIDSGFVTCLENDGHDVLDYGNIPVLKIQDAPDPNDISTCGGGGVISCAKQVGDACKQISMFTQRILEDNRICVTLGGDHSLSIGTVHGATVVHKDLGILWVDAHSDINTPLTSISGNIHGMATAFFIQETEPYMPRLPDFSWIQHKIPAENVVYIGLRSVDPPEAKLLDTLGIRTFSMEQIDFYGIQEVTRLALEQISPNRSRPIHVSFDIDAICESYVKSTGTPVPGGLTLREGVSLMETVSRTRQLVSLDIVEVNPLLGSEQDVTITAKYAKHLILGAFGHHRRGGSPSAYVPKPT